MHLAGVVMTLATDLYRGDGGERDAGDHGSEETVATSRCRPRVGLDWNP